MADVQTTDINTKPTVTAIDSNDQIYISDGGTALKKISYTNLAKAIIEQYNASQLAGATKTIQAAFNELNSNLWSLTGGTVVQANTDLDTLTTPGNYYSFNNVTLIHPPIANYDRGFVLKVESSAGQLDPVYVKQTFRYYTTNDVYVRAHMGDGWHAWEKLPTRSEIDTLNSKTKAYDYTAQSGSFLDWVSSTFTTNGEYYVVIATLNGVGLPRAATGIATVTKRNSDIYVHVVYGAKDEYITTYVSNAWTEWTKSPTRAEVDKLNNALIKDYGPIGNNKTYVESFQYLANQLPAGVPIMGTYNSSGAKVFWGYLYNERNYGMFEVINYTGNRATVILDNGTWKTV